MRIDNIIIRKSISILLITTLILSGFFITPIPAHALMVEKTVTKYHLDIGAQHIWGSGSSVDTAEWDTQKGGTIDIPTQTITFPQNVSNVKVYSYTSSKFKWGADGYTFNSNAYLGGESDFTDNYKDHVSNSIYNINCSSSGSKVNFSYTATLASKVDFDLKQKLKFGNLGFVLEVLGGAESVQDTQPIVYDRLIAGSQGKLADNVYGFMYFTPVIIQYDVKEMVEIGELDAGLDLPSTAKTGESYTVIDTSILDKILEVYEAVLKRKVGSGDWEVVTTWEGTGVKGENTGGSIAQSFDEVCDVTYIIEVTTKDGQTDTATKSITITDGRKISGQAHLVLDEYTYEGWPTEAYDESTFEVDGVSYSAKRAYEEKVATNKFRTTGGTVKKDGLTSAILTYPKRGVYPVTLEITTATGEESLDNGNMPVRKTPYLEANLGGFQKQNRKQILSLNVAIYPDKPIVDYNIAIKDLVSNEMIYLSKDSPQENGAIIKTRAAKMDASGQYWTKITVEFLTKLPRYSDTGATTRKFSYKAKVTDSKGDSDEVYKEFDVAPDKPPVPIISMQDSFLRAVGTNIASIQTSDASSSDGDQLQRTWSIANHSPLTGLAAGQANALATIPTGSFINATILSGYENLAFGTNQTIGFNKEGVGKTTVKLHVKDVWNEPTLEEYINPSDYLEAETTASTQVINIAPVVSIEPLNTLKANISIIVKANQFQMVQNQLNSLKASLIEKGIDGNISFVKVADGTKEGQARVDVDNTAGGGANNYDSERMYLFHGNDSNSFKIDAYDNDTAKVIWSYTTGANNISSIYIDRNKEKYVIANQLLNGTKSAIILDRNTGAYLSKVEGVYLDGEVFLSNDEKRLYCVNNTGIYKLDLKTGAYKCILADNTISMPRMNNGKIGFAAKMANLQYYIGNFDMSTEKIEKNVAPIYNYASGMSEYGGSGVSIIQWSNDGKILLIRTAYNYGDDYGGNVWIVDTKNATEQNLLNDNRNEDAISGGLILDGYGDCKYIVVTQVHRADAYEYYNSATIYDLTGKVIASISKPKTSGRTHLNNGYYDRKNNTISIYQGGFYGKSAVYDLNSQQWIKDWGTSTLDAYTGSLSFFDNGFYSFYNGATSERHEDFYYMYSKKYLTPQDNLFLKAIKRTTTFEGDVDNYVAFVDTDNSSLVNTNEFLEAEGTRCIGIEKSKPLEMLSDTIKSLSEAVRYKLQLIGNKDNSSTVKREINLLPNTQYNYSFNTQVISGTAIDTFMAERTPDNYNATKYYKEVIYQEDFSDIYGGKREESGVGGFSCTLDKAGYISFIMQGTYVGRQIYLDGKLIDDSSRQSSDDLQFLIFVPAGKHTITTNSVSSGITYNSLVKCAEAGHITTDDNKFKQSSVNIQEGNEGTVSGSFFTPKDLLFYKNDTAYTATKINGYDLVNKGYITYSSSSGYGYITDNGNQLNVHSDARVTNKGYLTANLTVTVKAPADKKLLIRSSHGIIKLNEGEQTYFTFSSKVYYANYGYSREFSVMSDIEAVEIPTDNCSWFADSNAILLGNPSVMAAGNKVSAFSYGKDFYWIDTSTATCKVYKCKIGDKEEFNTVISFTNMYSTSNLNLLISNFKLEMINNSKNAKGEQFKEKFASVNSLNKWQVNTNGSGRAEMAQYESAEKEEDTPLVYKKGQLVAYNINYSDYEKDPSKSGYWLYAHTPYNDGEHPDGAIIYDEDGNIKSVCGQAITTGAITIDEALTIAKSKGLKILTAPIDRFYVDGKYTVFHWEYDDTSRGLIAGGYSNYDKSSNMADLTFYIEGGASAPWITGISTSPAKVTENNYFSLNIGIDDAEKDVLNLTTEVYKDRKLIYTHRKKNILPVDAAGNSTTNAAIAVGYPVTNTGALPDKAQAGTYEVVATVRDQTGAGLGTYKFIVISEGKITGYVNHTDKWDENRKKYNLSWFDSEVNTAYSYADYLALPDPRKRGTNVFWSGEKFMLRAAVAGSPTKVTCNISGTSYSATMSSTGTKNGEGETIYTGSLWSEDMVNKWGMKDPEQLTFTFTATYSGGTIKTHKATVIVDNMNPYWRLHRAF